MFTTLLLLLAVAAIAAHLGWFRSPQPWEAASGWDRIPDADRPAEPFAGEFDLVWLGHSGFLLRWRGTTLLLDPNTSPWCIVTRRIMALPPDLAAAGPVDAVLISHAHYDHLDAPTLARVPSIGTTLIPAGSENYLTPAVRAHVRPRPMRIGESARIGDLEVIAVPAAHKGNRFHPLGGPRFAVGYIIRSPSCTLYYAGDTGLQNDFAAIRDQFHPDVAILPIGAFLPRIPLRYFHTSPEDAAGVARALGVRTVVPCHFGTFALAADRPSTALPRFAAAARAAGVRWAMPRWAAAAEDLAPR